MLCSHSTKTLCYDIKAFRHNSISNTDFRAAFVRVLSVAMIIAYLYHSLAHVSVVTPCTGVQFADFAKCAHIRSICTVMDD